MASSALFSYCVCTIVVRRLTGSDNGVQKVVFYTVPFDSNPPIRLTVQLFLILYGLHMAYLLDK